MTLRSMLRSAFSGPGGLTRLGGALLLLGTVASQHPNPSFDRVKDKDTFSSLFPNWRFFAPEPAQHDYHIAYRTLDEDGTTSPWWPVDVIEGRQVRQLVWYPGRRVEKAVFDIASELIMHLDEGLEVIRNYPTYKVLREFVREQVRSSRRRTIKGFQFGLIRHTGYAELSEPEVVFVSPYTPMTEDGSDQGPSDVWRVRGHAPYNASRARAAERDRAKRTAVSGKSQNETARKRST